VFCAKWIGGHYGKLVFDTEGTERASRGTEVGRAAGDWLVVRKGGGGGFGFYFFIHRLHRFTQIKALRRFDGLASA
jgi:hypothetical protein